ncbi:MAG: hypothetical protein LBH38_03220 [Holosporales bacterium]|jgi:hypothetical protein|nr:hypothetical protein [Holosporales bacterium]
MNNDMKQNEMLTRMSDAREAGLAKEEARWGVRGIVEGKEEGRQEATRKMSVGLCTNGIDKPILSSATGLSVDRN